MKTLFPQLLLPTPDNPGQSKHAAKVVKQIQEGILLKALTLPSVIFHTHQFLYPFAAEPQQ